MNRAQLKDFQEFIRNAKHHGASWNFLTACKIFGVQNQIERVVANLVSNALQVMGSTDRIEIEESDEGANVVVTVANTGSYIPPEDLENIFQPFFTKGKADGTGLGLAICRRIVAEHGGSISVLSKEHSDTCFIIKLPLAGNT
ncbi:MAG: ATP-binding protein [Pseudomonadota bacterium]